MLFKSVLSAAALFFAGVAAQGLAEVEHKPVFTATRVYNTATDIAPFIVKATTTFTWTASSSTIVAKPTGPGL